MEFIKEIFKRITFKRVVIILIMTNIFIVTFPYFNLANVLKYNTKLEIKYLNEVVTYYDEYGRDSRTFEVYSIDDKEKDKLIKQLNKVGDNKKIVDEAVELLFNMLTEKEKSNFKIRLTDEINKNDNYYRVVKHGSRIFLVFFDPQKNYIYYLTANSPTNLFNDYIYEIS